jgi:hypothetical protein
MLVKEKYDFESGWPYNTKTLVPCMGSKLMAQNIFKIRGSPASWSPCIPQYAVFLFSSLQYIYIYI